MADTNAYLTVERIRHRLHTMFDGLIDLSDVAKKDPTERENHFLTRALAAFVLVGIADADAKAAASAITDDYEDGGIDALYVSAAAKTVYVVQSKWHFKGERTIDLGDV